MKNMEPQTKLADAEEVRAAEHKVYALKLRIDHAQYFREMSGRGVGCASTEEDLKHDAALLEELEIEKAKLEDLYEKRYEANEKERREKRTKERIEQSKRERRKGKPYDKHMAMCNGVPVW